MAEPLTPDEIKRRLATDGRTQTRLWWAAFARDLIATVESAEAEARALREQLAAAHNVIRRLQDGWEADEPCIGPPVLCWFQEDNDEPEPLTDAEAAVIRAATADPTPDPETP